MSTLGKLRPSRPGGGRPRGRAARSVGLAWLLGAQALGIGLAVGLPAAILLAPSVASAKLGALLTYLASFFIGAGADEDDAQPELAARLRAA